MIGRIPYPLSLYPELVKPALAPEVRWDAYLAVLESSASDPKECVGVATFKRWCKARFGLDQTASLNEGRLEEFAAALKDGTYRTERNRPYAPGVAAQIPSVVRTVHNRACRKSGASNLCVRELLPRLVARRLERFAHLSAKTREALCWFEAYGSAPSGRKGKSSKALTTATRVKATYAALSLLDQLGKSGLEQLHTADLPELSADAPDYRSQCRLRHAAATVYRCCVWKGLLDENPLDGTSNETFDGQAKRDFIPPEQLDKVLDLETVDRASRQQVMDRTVMLLYLDLGLRKNELAAVRVEDVRQVSPGKYQVILAGSAQKMGDKASAVIDVLYPQTAELLAAYLKQRGSKSGSLFTSTKGAPASGPLLSACVKRESLRIGVTTYFGAVPSCHALRRTLATVNADRIGMKLNPHEIAQRLRCGMDVAYKHYVQDNVLLRSIKADEQRRQLANDPHVEAQSLLAGLQKLGISGDALAAVQAEVERKLAPRPVYPSAAWLAEDEVVKRLEARWEVEIAPRVLREYFTGVGALDHRGERGRARYREDVVADLAGRDPLEVYTGPDLSRRQRSALIAQFDVVRIGHLVLLRRDDGPRVLRILRSKVSTAR
jgi:integrase